MSASEVDTVRRFNRVVTERIGALNDAYLARDRPLGASRVLWEIGHGCGDARTLRARLGLDSGYLSRLLRTLEADELITVSASDTDARVRALATTDRGRDELAMLDAGSDALADSLLAPLDPGQRGRLVEAMSTVERMLTAGQVTMEIADPTGADARYCLGRYFDELDSRFDTGFDPDLSISADAHELREPAGLLLVAHLRGEPIGCGALKLHAREPVRVAEVKRMWVSTASRGLGLGRRMLVALETRAADHEVDVLRLETNRSLGEAIGLYRSAGYREVPAFNDEPFAHHWFEKDLTDPETKR